jgi:2-polyprenyl-6-methoxyphenol hydroxylase-like FAD-dependent oxidoreductase
MAERSSQAVVLGAGLAGLLAARVLSEFYGSVTVVERDALPDHAEQRTGVPQGRHLHSLLSRGTQVIGELFPGILDELAAAGAVVDRGHDLSRLYVRVGHHELNRTGRLADPEPLAAYQSSRPFLEFHLRRRVGALENVTILDRQNIVAPVLAHDTVTGVRIINRDTGISSTLTAGLVVDATGRAGRTSHFLASQGYGAVPAEQVASISGYSSQLLRIPPGRIRERMAFINQGPRAPGALLVAYEDETWMLAVSYPAELGGPPSDFAEMMDAAARLLPEGIMAGVRDGVPVGQISVSRTTAAVWRRYDQMSRLPSGLVVLGDALCSLNPLYGQGMTMAALQALALRDCLRADGADVPRRFYLAAAEHIGPVWSANRANDRPPAAGDRPRRMAAWTQRAVLTAAATDIVVAEQIMRVRGLLDPPDRLRDPALLVRVLLANLRPAPRAATASVHSTISHADETAIRALVDRQARRRRGRTEITRLRYLTPDVALIQARAAIAGRLHRMTRRNTSVAVRTDEGWQLAFSQNSASWRFTHA